MVFQVELETARRVLQQFPEQCPSTHGGGGYAIGSYWRGKSIICGLCGTEITDPPPTGGSLDHYEYPSQLHRMLSIGGKPVWRPKWPDWIAGQRD